MLPSLPPLFIERTKKIVQDEWPALEQALQAETPISIRLNDKINIRLPFETIAWCDVGYYLPKRYLFTMDPLFHAGTYYVQEASSQFLHHIIRQHIKTPVTALDLCAAPGGKSTLLLNALHSDSLLVSNEMNRLRANILVENIQKWGNSNVAVTNLQPAAFQQTPAFFDLIIIDAPCSGEGMFRKDIDSIHEWSEANVFQCAIRQKEIVSDVWSALKENGWLIYSTCTYNREENEDNIQWIIETLGAEKIPIPIDPSWGITQTAEGYRFFPHKTLGEGFFITLLRKTSMDHKSIPTKKKKMFPVNRQHVAINELLKGNDWKIIQDNEIIFAIDKRFEEQINSLQAALPTLLIGNQIGEFKGKDLIPHTALALSKNLKRGAFPEIEVSFEDAIRFLKRTPIHFENKAKGYYLITFQNIPLGFIKNIGNRSNNLYPMPWHIRMNHDPTYRYESPLGSLLVTQESQ
jgi:16S rRNA C967 or C1407 C5-methylase (RsmB/RsmF family)/NOL1/NOP2/fmu family ribosome biogenesis protein